MAPGVNGRGMSRSKGIRHPYLWDGLRNRRDQITGLSSDDLRMSRSAQTNTSVRQFPLGVKLTAYPRTLLLWSLTLTIRKEGEVLLAEVNIQDGESMESALRRFKRKVLNEEIIKDIKRHAYYL